MTIVQGSRHRYAAFLLHSITKRGSCIQKFWAGDRTRSYQLSIIVGTDVGIGASEREHGIVSSEFSVQCPGSVLTSFVLGLFRDLQASFYLEVSSAQVFDIKKYEIAFLSIQRAPVRAFERDKKNRISRRILQVLLGKCLSNFTLVEDHIALLTGYLSTSHKLQNLLISTRDVFEGEPTGTPINRIPLISLAQKLDSELGTDISSLVAFRRLVYHFFRYSPSRFPNPV